MTPQRPDENQHETFAERLACPSVQDGQVFAYRAVGDASWLRELLNYHMPYTIFLARAQRLNECRLSSSGVKHHPNWVAGSVKKNKVMSRPLPLSRGENTRTVCSNCLKSFPE